MDAGRVGVFLKGRVQLGFWDLRNAGYMLSSEGFILVQMWSGLGGRICSIGHVF